MCDVRIKKITWSLYKTHVLKVFVLFNHLDAYRWSATKMIIKLWYSHKDKFSVLYICVKCVLFSPQLRNWNYLIVCSLHCIPPLFYYSAEEEGPVAGSFNTRLPAILNLSHERLTTDGLFLMENGYDLFLWVGRGVNPGLLSALLGKSYDRVLE